MKKKPNTTIIPDSLESILAVLQTAGLPRVELGEFCAGYLEICKETKSKNYIKDIELVIKKLQAEFSKHKLLASFNLQECELIIMKWRKTAPAGVECYLRTTKAMFSKAMDWGYSRENPFEKVKLPKRQKEEVKIITIDERAKLQNTIKDNIMGTLVKMNLNSGLRVGEITYLRYRNIDLTQRRIQVGDKDFTTKSKKSRYVYMSEELFELCQKIMAKKEKRKDDDFIFSKPNGQPFLPTTLSKKFKKACRAAGIDERIHHHSMRHTFCSNIVNNGGNIMAAKELMGHSSIQVTQRYCHPNEDMQREAVKLLDTINFKNNLNKE